MEKPLPCLNGFEQDRLKVTEEGAVGIDHIAGEDQRGGPGSADLWALPA